LPHRFPELSESDLNEIVSRLWATQIWSNKQHLVHKIVSVNGLDKLKREMNRLWDASLPVADRYEHFLENVTYLGPAAVTEMMCYIEPYRCGIWNQKARAALRVLSLDSYVNLGKYKISGQEYETFNRLLAAIAAEIRKSSPKEINLLTVDYFLYEIAVAEPAKEEQATLEVAAGHDEIRDMIAAVGSMLGFDADTEVTIAHGAKVDVVWRARIGNLGMVTYVFEVQKSGSIDSLILNLQKSKNAATVQKVIAVADDTQLRKIEHETDGLQAEFRNSLALWKVSDVQLVSHSLQKAMEVIEKLGLVPSKQ